MLTNSGHFEFTRPSMLSVFSDLMVVCNIDMDETMDLTRTLVSMSGRIAMMKAVEHSRFERVGEIIVAISFSGSFEASSYRTIMATGADVAFMGSKETNASVLAGGPPRKL